METLRARTTKLYMTINSTLCLSAAAAVAVATAAVVLVYRDMQRVRGRWGSWDARVRFTAIQRWCGEVVSSLPDADVACDIRVHALRTFPLRVGLRRGLQRGREEPPSGDTLCTRGCCAAAAESRRVERSPPRRAAGGARHRLVDSTHTSTVGEPLSECRCVLRQLVLCSYTHT
jgi:hypothetical protein